MLKGLVFVQLFIDTHIGVLGLTADDKALIGVSFGGGEAEPQRLQELSGGAGEMVQEVILDVGLMKKVLKFGLPDKFIEHGSVSELRKSVGLDSESMFEKIMRFLDKI